MKKIESSKTDGRDKPEKVCQFLLCFLCVTSVTVLWLVTRRSRFSNLASCRWSREFQRSFSCYGRMFFNGSTKFFFCESVVSVTRTLPILIPRIMKVLGLLQCIAIAANLASTVCCPAPSSDRNFSPRHDLPLLLSKPVTRRFRIR